MIYVLYVPDGRIKCAYLPPSFPQKKKPLTGYSNPLVSTGAAIANGAANKGTNLIIFHIMIDWERSSGNWHPGTGGNNIAGSTAAPASAQGAKAKDIKKTTNSSSGGAINSGLQRVSKNRELNKLAFLKGAVSEMEKKLFFYVH